jgi:hypothetical protein
MADDFAVIIAEYVLPKRPWLEFGVATGHTIRFLAAQTTAAVYGFDWFQGLPEDWRDAEGNLMHPAGTFACPVPDGLPANVELVIGRFEDTLPGWLSEHGQPFGLVHIDCDLYNSTRFVLDALEPWLDGAVVAFDEIRNHPAYVHHEQRAFDELLLRHKFGCELLGHQHSNAATFRLTDMEKVQRAKATVEELRMETVRQHR